jgi:hypothetical protein
MPREVQVGAELYRIAHQLEFSERELEAFCNTICGGVLEDSFYPQSNAPFRLPSLAASMDCMSNIIQACGNITIDNVPTNHGKFFEQSHRVDSRSVYRTSGGTFVFGPLCVEPGDFVVAVLGFDAVMILRWADGNNYKVVGESYCYGYMCCEGFVGSLPNSLRRVWVRGDRGEVYSAYLEVQSGLLTIEDPRLGTLPPGWKFLEHEDKHFYPEFWNEETGELTGSDPRLQPEVLIARGVKIQYFELV